MIRIKVTRGPMEGGEFSFSDHDIFVFGRRKSTCHAYIDNDPYVSRHHFILEVCPPLIRLRDLGSRNGTVVNSVKHGGRTDPHDQQLMGKATGAKVDLQDGDVIEVGKTQLQVIFDNAPESTSSDAEGSVDGDRTRTQLEQEGSPDPGRLTKHEVSAAANSKERNTSIEPAINGKHSRPARQDSPQKESPVQIQTTPHPHDADIVEEHRPVGDLPLIEGYRLEKPLGSGAMGTVYLARRSRDEQPVAIKFLKPQVRSSQRIRSSFLREMELICRLRHKNIVHGYDTGMAASDYYFVMEYCDGGSISRLFRKRPELTHPKNVARLLAQLLEGLTFAQEEGLVHRDLKPANILVSRSRGRLTAKLADFGLAKEFAKAGLSGLTITGSFGGSLPFMSREQLTNYKYVNPASDVFSLGASFYRLITGFYPRPDEGRDPLEVILNVDAVPLRKRLPQYHLGIANLLDNALLTDCRERYGNAREMLSELRFIMKKESWLRRRAT